jgi:hypothetical protein
VERIELLARGLHDVVDHDPLDTLRVRRRRERAAVAEKRAGRNAEIVRVDRADRDLGRLVVLDVRELAPELHQQIACYPN